MKALGRRDAFSLFIDFSSAQKNFINGKRQQQLAQFLESTSIEDVMQHSKHRSYQMASQYYNTENALKSRAVRLLD